MSPIVHKKYSSLSFNKIQYVEDGVDDFMC